MKRNKIYLIWISLAVFNFHSSLMADILFLQNGEVLENIKILGLDKKSITILDRGKNKKFTKKQYSKLLYGQNTLEPINILLNDETTISGYIVDQDTEKVRIRQKKNSKNEKVILKSKIKQMSNKKFVFFYPEIQFRVGGFQTVNSGHSEMGIAPIIYLGYMLRPPWISNSILGFEVGFAKSESKVFADQQLLHFPIMLYYQYLFQLPQSVWAVSSKIGMGAFFLLFDSGEGDSYNAVDPSLLLGAGLVYTLINRSLFLNLFVDYYLIYETKGQFHNVMTSLGIQYRY